MIQIYYKPLKSSCSLKFLDGLKKTVTPRNFILGFLIRLELVISDGSCYVSFEYA